MSGLTCRSISERKVRERIAQCRSRSDLVALVEEIDQLFLRGHVEVGDHFWMQLTGWVGQRNEELGQ